MKRTKPKPLHMNLIVAQFLEELRVQLAAYDKVDPNLVHISKTPKKIIRLLNLKVWSLRYNVGIGFILKVLLDHYRSQSAPYCRTGHASGFRVPLPNLTGEYSRSMIEHAVTMSFSGYQNEAAATFEQRVRYRAPVLTLRPRPFDTLRGFVREYSRIMHRRRYRLSKPSRLSRRPWRNNPWRA